MVPAAASFVLPLLAPVPQPDLETCAGSRSSSATQCPRVLSIGDRPLVGNRPAIQVLGSLEAACDDGAIAAVKLITLGRPADSFGLSERCLLGAASSSCRRARCTFGPRCRSARRAERKRDQSDQGGLAETRFDRTAWGAASSNHTISTTQSLGLGPCKNSCIYCAGVRALARPARL
jgi:hypothetical protein